MADYSSTMTRSSSTDSSALSNIEVAAATTAGAEDDLSVSDRVSASTPPTSLVDTGDMDSAKKMALEEAGGGEESARRPKRARARPSTYNLKKLSDAQLPVTGGSSRNVSGFTGWTLVEGEAEAEAGTPFGAKVEKSLDLEWEMPAAGGAGGAARGEGEGEGEGEGVRRRPSVRERVRGLAGRVVESVLGKRGRGGRTGEGGKGRAEEEEDVPRWKKELDTGPKGLLDELDLDVEPEMPAPPPSKKARLSGKAALKEMSQPPAAAARLAKAATASKNMKKWQKEGLYVGQDADFDPTQPGGKKKLQKKRPTSSTSDDTASDNATATKRTFMNLPMFNYLDKTRGFVVPFDVFAPSWKKGDEKPKDWHQINRNRLVGEAKDLWEKSERLPASMCVCQAPVQGDLGCDDHCINRVMQYECNDDNCNLTAAQCGNRLFADLAARTKKGGAFNIGVEVLKTPTRGFGVRSCRTWAPGQIIMEYTGEIVSEGECQRRMREEYKDKQCYYLMELERGLIIDGTKGSMARFINHSCEPNCEVRMVKVNGTPRMGVFAGDRGVATGEELTYDYNFDNFGSAQQRCYCGAPTCRGYLSKRLNAAEQKNMVRVENERKRKAAEEAMRHAEEEGRRKRVKSERGSGWRGWVAVDEPETRERLKKEKREREAAAKSSERARRLAARRGDGGAATEREPLIKEGGSRRRKTIAVEEHVVRKVEDDALDDELAAEDPVVRPTSSGKGKANANATLAASPGSHSIFTEDLPRPTSVHSTATSITRKTEITITETETEEAIHQITNNTDLDVHGVDDEEVVTKKRPIKVAMKSVGQAVKNGLLGAAGRSQPLGGSEKVLKQSTLSFGKVG